MGLGAKVKYIYYQKDDDYHNANWCIVDDKVCTDYKGYHLRCPKIKLYKNGKIVYDESGKDEFPSEKSDIIQISEGDVYHIEETYKRNGWQMHERKNCPTHP